MRTCSGCGERKGFYAEFCRACKKERGLYPKPNLGKKAAEHPAWKGGRDIDRDGYVRTYAPEHPWPRSHGFVREHIRVMELHIGRRIRSDEVVHHRDHNRENNGTDNLELMSRGAHSRHHRLHDSHLRERDDAGRFA